MTEKMEISDDELEESVSGGVGILDRAKRGLDKVISTSISDPFANGELYAQDHGYDGDGVVDTVARKVCGAFNWATQKMNMDGNGKGHLDNVR